MLGNTSTPEAKVWFAIQGKRPHMVKLRGEFSAAIMEKGFGLVEGSELTTWGCEDKYVQDDEHKTYSQILTAECGNEASAKAKVAWAQGARRRQSATGRWQKDSGRTLHGPARMFIPAWIT